MCVLKLRLLNKHTAAILKEEADYFTAITEDDAFEITAPTRSKVKKKKLNSESRGHNAVHPLFPHGNYPSDDYNDNTNHCFCTWYFLK